MGALEKDRASAIVYTEWGIFTMKIILAILFLWVNSSDGRYRHHVGPLDNQLIITYIAVEALITFVMNITITVGVRKEHSTCCIVWCILNAIFIIILTVNFMFTIFLLNPIAILAGLFIIGYKIYAGKCIKGFADTVYPSIGDVSSNSNHVAVILNIDPPPPYTKFEDEAQAQIENHDKV